MRFTLSRPAPFDGEAVLPLDDAKEHLRVTSDDEDALIEALRDAAIDWVERHCSVALTQRSFVWNGDGFTGRGLAGFPVRDFTRNPIVLPVRPVVSVQSVNFLDPAGTAVAMVTGDWRLSGEHLLPKAQTYWPVTLWGAGAVTVSFTAGYLDALVEAPALLAAVKLLLGHLYEFREAAVSGVSISEVPMGVTALCAAYRLISFG